MKKGSLLWSVALGALVLVFTSCKKDPISNLTAEESRIYITNHDSTTLFQSFKTYSLVDSVAVISNNKLEGKLLTNYDSEVLNALKASMQARGFQLVAKSSQPDLGINVSRVSNTYTGVMSYPDYWGGYRNFYDPYYWGYPGYGYYSPNYSYGVYQITEGGLSIELLDLKGAPSNGNKIKPVWTALARGTGVFHAANANQQVLAFFAQSPYLKTNN
ncbi:MAG: DUF4136 domain-containing protein [Chitinophagaceae bacterium]